MYFFKVIKHYATRFSFQYNHFLGDFLSKHVIELSRRFNSVPKRKRISDIFYFIFFVLKNNIFDKYFKIKIPNINGPLWISNLIKHIKNIAYCIRGISKCKLVGIKNCNNVFCSLYLHKQCIKRLTTCNVQLRRNSHICQSGGREKKSYLPLCCDINSGILYLVCMLLTT